MEEYHYKGLAITPKMIEEIIIRLFNGTSNKRDTIVSQVLDFHISNGGLASEAQDFPRSVKVALSKMGQKGYAKNRAYGIWSINKSDEPIVEVDEDVENNDETAIEDIPTHRIYGKGAFAVYCYYFENYKKLAILEGRSTWPCKIGRSDKDPLIRVLSQTSTALPEKPRIDFIIRTEDSSLLETTIHSVLKMRHQQCEGSPGSEWFDTNPDEVIKILRVCKKFCVNG